MTIGTPQQDIVASVDEDTVERMLRMDRMALIAWRPMSLQVEACTATTSSPARAEDQSTTEIVVTMAAETEGNPTDEQ